MDYSEILIEIAKATKSYRKNVLNNNHKQAYENALSVYTLGAMLSDFQHKQWREHEKRIATSV